MKTLLQSGAVAAVLAVLGPFGVAGVAQANDLSSPPSVCKPYPNREQNENLLQALQSFVVTPQYAATLDRDSIRRAICPIVRHGDNNGVRFVVHGTGPSRCTLFAYRANGSPLISKTIAGPYWPKQYWFAPHESPDSAYFTLVCTLNRGLDQHNPTKIYGIRTVD